MSHKMSIDEEKSLDLHTQTMIKDTDLIKIFVIDKVLD